MIADAFGGIGLKRRISREVPRLGSLSHTERVCELRNWAFANQTIASRSERLDTLEGHAIYKSSAAKLYRSMSRDRGFLCAGSAYALKRLYELYGYRSYVINMGDEVNGAFTHVSTLVELHERGRSVLSVQDPYFNCDLRDRQGEPLDHKDLIEMLAAGKDGDVRVEFGRSTELTVVINRTDEPQLALEHLRGFGLDPERSGTRIGTDRYRMRKALDLERYFSDIPALERWLYSAIGRTNPLYIYLFPFGTSGEKECQALMEWVRERTALIKLKGRIEA